VIGAVFLVAEVTDFFFVVVDTGEVDTAPFLSLAWVRGGIVKDVGTGDSDSALTIGVAISFPALR